MEGEALFPLLIAGPKESYVDSCDLPEEENLGARNGEGWTLAVATRASARD